MCGFTGIYSAGGNIGEAELSRIVVAQKRLKHRGPDDSGFYRNRSFAVGFNRLSLVALAEGHQPFESSDGRYIAVFNGEIYNFRTLSRQLFSCSIRSEVEVITRLYALLGVEAFSLLRGMFSIVIYDTEQDEVVCARDTFGIKPFFYTGIGGSFLFASELKGLAVKRSERKIADSAVNLFCTFEYVPEPNTVYENIFSLPGGHYLRIARTDTEIRPFSRKTFSASGPIKREDRKRKLREVLEESVGLCMQSDVEVGTFLSGGIDSSIITALAAKRNPDIKAFSIGFDTPDYPSEVRFARETAAYLGIELIERIFTADDFMAAFEPTVYYLDAPMADPSTIGVYLLAQTAAKQVKAVLSGEGADELFGGYKVYQTTALTARCGKLQPAVDYGLYRFSKILPGHSRLRPRIRNHCFPLERDYVGPTWVMGDRERKKLLQPSFYCDVRSAEITGRFLHASGISRLQKMQLCDWNLWLPSDILHKGDRLSMAHSLEVRVPFLDGRVFEVATRLTDRDKVSAHQTKRLLRDAFAGLLPEETLRRAKQGFPVPVAVWLRNELYEWAYAYLGSDIAQEVIDSKQALRLFEKFRKGDVPDFVYRQIWLLLVWVAWYKLYVVQPDRIEEKGL